MQKGAKINAVTYKEIVEHTYLVDCWEHFGGQHFVFQQDGASSHTARTTQDYLDKNCPGFIKKTEWPASSPDLNPLDYFIWGYLQQAVDKEKPKDEVSLELAIRRAAAGMPLEMIRRGVDGFYKRVALCVEAEGRQFKHMLQRKNLPVVPGREAEGQDINVEIQVEPPPQPGGEAISESDAMDFDP